MQYILPAIAVLVSLVVLAILAALYVRLRRGASPVEGELRQRIVELESEADGLRGELDEARSARVQAETRLEAEQANLQEQRRLLEEAEIQLKDAFKALSAEALKDSRQQFLGDAGERLRPIQDLLKTYEGRLREIEKARTDAYGGLKNHLDALAQAHQTLQKEAHQLTTALRSPTVRGRWGEMTLRRVVEVAGMSPHCDFDEQVTASGDGGVLRPDMVIRMPGARDIIVDSKVPLVAYMDAVEATDATARQVAFERHAADVRKHVQALSRKAYWDQFSKAPDFVVLFLPGESFFSAALEQDRSLMEDAMRSKVFLATPTTLMALLNVVAHGWRQQESVENTERIVEAGRVLYDRVRVFVEHFSKVGDGISRASKAYDAAVGSHESRIAPAARRLHDLAAVSGKELPDVERAAHPTRLITDGGADTDPADDNAPGKPGG